MKSVIQKYQTVVYYMLVLTISGVLLIVQSHIARANEYSLSLPQLAPAFSVFIICLPGGERRFLSRLWKAVPLDKKDLIWVPIVLALTILAVSISAGILSGLGIPYLKWNGTIVNVLVMTCGCFFEEVGWRGFLLPKLEKRYSPLISTLIVGTLWGFWHMSFQLGIIGFLVFIVTAVEMSLLMTWIYHRTNGNLLLMALWHASINVWNQILLTGRLTASGFAVFAAVLGFFCCVVFIKNQKLYLDKAKQ